MKKSDSLVALLAVLTRQSLKMSCANEILLVITNLNGDNSVFRVNFAALPN